MAKQNAVQVQNPTSGNMEPQYVDVELHGYTVPLLELKKALRIDKKLKQQDIAVLTAAHNGGTALHQTSVSNYLIGKVEMHNACIATLESIFTPAEAASMASGAPLGTTPVFPNTTQAPKAPAFAGAMGLAGVGAAPAKDNAVAQTVAAPVQQNAVVAGKALEPFPVERAQELATAVRKAKENGEISTTFSLRKLMAWGRAFLLLQTEGYDPKEALAGGFHLAAEGKTYGEDQRFLKDLFQAKFGYESKPPRENSRTALKDGKHPMSYLIAPFIREGMAVWLTGETGAGKTHTVEDIARDLGREMLRFQGKRDATTDDFVGGFSLVERNGVAVTEFNYGPLPLAMKNGAILNIDEITALGPEVLFELQAVLEGKPLVLTKNRGEVIHPAPGFCIVAADNSLGLGEATEYVGTNVMNEAFRDRFLFVKFGYMPEAMERKALAQNLAQFGTARGWAVAA